MSPIWFNAEGFLQINWQRSNADIRAALKKLMEKTPCKSKTPMFSTSSSGAAVATGAAKPAQTDATRTTQY